MGNNLPPIEISKGFIYSTWSGLLRVYEGRVVMSAYNNNTILFEQTTPARNVIQCAKEPEIVYNKVVWLAERDDDKARQILIAYEETQIAKLQEKIQNHRSKINTLKEGTIQ